MKELIDDNRGDGALPAARATAAEPKVSALRDGIANAGQWLRRRLGFDAKPACGYVHINRTRTDAKSLTTAKCIDCKQDTVFVSFFQEWYGWTETCIRCGRKFADGEWLELDFYRHARRDNIKRALERWDRSADAETIRRVKVPAQGMETRQGGDGTAPSQDDSPVGATDAPNPHDGGHNEGTH